MRITILFFSSIIFIMSCSTHSNRMTESKGNGLYEIDFDKMKDDPDDYFLFSTLYKGIKTIILETNESCLIGSIKKIRVFDQYILILDGISAKSLYVFDKDGKFVRKIGRTGGGPGEYVFPIDFTIDRDNKTVYVLDAQSQRINKYDIITGNFIHTINYDKNIRSYNIEYVGGRLYADAHFFIHLEDNFLLRVIHELSGKVDNQYLNVMEYSKEISNTLGNFQEEVFFLRENGNAVFVHPFMDHIIEIGKDSIFSLIDFKGKELLTSENIKNVLDKGYSGFLNEFIRINKYFYTYKFIENKDLISIEFYKGTSIKRILINKKSKQVYDISKRWDDLLIIEKGESSGSIPKVGCYDSAGVYYYLGNSDEVFKFKSAAKTGVLSPKLDRLEDLKNLEEDANPVIFYYEFKD